MGDEFGRHHANSGHDPNAERTARTNAPRTKTPTSQGKTHLIADFVPSAIPEPPTNPGDKTGRHRPIAAIETETHPGTQAAAVTQANTPLTKTTVTAAGHDPNLVRTARTNAPRTKTPTSQGKTHLIADFVSNAIPEPPTNPGDKTGRHHTNSGHDPNPVRTARANRPRTQTSPSHGKAHLIARFGGD